MGIEMGKWRHGEGERERQIRKRRQSRRDRQRTSQGVGKTPKKRQLDRERGVGKLHKQTKRKTETTAETEAARDINRQGRLKR